MAKTNFDKCLEIILEHEGGYVDHPKDPGGATNMGVTKKTYEDWIGKAVTKQTIEDLKVADVIPIYKARYWDAVAGSDLPRGVDLMVFDFAVNSGVSRSAKYLQSIVGATADGRIGPITLAAVDDFIEQYGVYKLIHRLSDDRVMFLKQIKTFDTFGKGWMRRVNKTTSIAVAME